MRIDGQEANRRLSSTRNIANLRRVDGPSNPYQDPTQPTHTNPTKPLTETTRPAIESSKPQESIQTPDQLPEIVHQVIDYGASRRGHPNVPESMRDEMASILIQGGDAKDIAQTFGVSIDTVYRAATGRVGGNIPTEQRREKIEGKRIAVEDQAVSKLMEALGLITAEDLAECKPKDLSSIASNLSKVAASMRGQVTLGDNAKVLIYSPIIRDESKYKVIEVDSV